MPEHECHALPVSGRLVAIILYCLLRRNGVVRQLDGIYLVTLLVQRTNGIDRIGVVRIIHSLLGTQGGLVQFGIRRTTGYAAQAQPLQAECVCRAEHCAHVVLAAYIIQYNYYRHFSCGSKRLRREAVHIGYRFLG